MLFITCQRCGKIKTQYFVIFLLFALDNIQYIDKIRSESLEALRFKRRERLALRKPFCTQKKVNRQYVRVLAFEFRFLLIL